MHSGEPLGDGRGFGGWPTGSGQPRRPKNEYSGFRPDITSMEVGRSLGLDGWPIISILALRSLDMRANPFLGRLGATNTRYLGLPIVLPSQATNRPSVRCDETNSAIKGLHYGANVGSSNTGATENPQDF